MSYDLFTGLLKMFNDFTRTDTQNINFTYEHNNDNLYKLKSLYNIESIAGEGDETEKNINLLHWLSSNIYHKGDYDNHIERNSLALLDYSFNKGAENGINCASLSLILTECCLAIGLKARTVFIMPCSPYDFDNHVVTSVYVSNLKKWIMLDPTLDSYVTDKSGNILDVYELRKALANQDEICFNKEMNYNNEISDNQEQETKEYYAKDLFYFLCFEKSCYAQDEDNNNRIIAFAPFGYDVKKSQIERILYRIKKQGDNEMLQKWLKNTIDTPVVYGNFNDFIGFPVV